MDLPTGDYSGEWIDVATGIKTTLGSFHHRGGEKIIESPKFNNGLALRLTRKVR
jgi:hypothetical protein